jgi:molecular chaperone HscB
MPDHFERLGLPRRFSVDPAAVERAYLERSRAAHPDFHATAAPAEQRASLERTAALNEAYLAVRDPFRRAEYLLTLLGGPSAHSAKHLDQAFLIEMMDIRERIEEAGTGGPCGAAREAIRDELRAKDDDLLAGVGAAFARLEGLAGDSLERAELLTAIRRQLNAAKTIRSLIRDLDIG